MALPEGLTLVEDKRVKSSSLPSGLTLIDDSPSGISLKEEEEAVQSDDTFSPMPEGFNKGEYSSDEELDRQIAERGWKRLQIEESKERGEVSPPVAGYQKLGQLFGAGLDIAGKELVDSTKGLAGLATAAYDATLPDSVKEYLAEEGSDLKRGVIELQHKLGVDEALAKGGKKLVAWWDSLDKQTRRNLHSTGLISAVVPVRKVVGEVGKVVSEVAAPAKVGVVRNLAKEKLDDAIEFVRPHLSGQYEREALKRTQKGIYTPTLKEKEMGELVQGLKGYTVRGNPIKNKDVVLDALRTKKVKLDADIAKYGTEIPPTKLNDIGDAVVSLTKDNADFVGVNAKVPMLRIAKVRELLKAKAAANGGKLTSKGVHEVRQEWDKIIEERSKTAFDPSGKQFDPILNTDKVIRNKLNDIIDETTTVNVAKGRNEVHHLITATDNIVGRLQRTHDDFLKDTLNTIGNTARGFWATKTLGKFAGAGTLGGAAAVDPKLAGGIMAVLGAGYLGKKIVMSRSSRKVLVGMLEGLDQAGKATKSASELVKIKQHKTSLAKLIANIAIQEADEADKEE